MQGVCNLKTVIHFVVVFFILQITVVFIWYIRSDHRGGIAVVHTNNDLSDSTTDTRAHSLTADTHVVSASYDTNTERQSILPANMTTEQSSSLVSGLPLSHVTSVLLQRYHGISFPTASSSRVPVLVIGASSPIGSRVVKHFYDNKIKVFATEDNVNLQPDELLWYRWEHLMKMGVSPHFKNYTGHHTTISLLKETSPKSIVYIPAPCYSNEYYDLRTIVEQLENFIQLLEINNKLTSKRSPVVLIIPSQPVNPICDFFKLSLLSYHEVHHIDAVVVESKGSLYGPWQSVSDHMTSNNDCYIDDLAKHIGEIISGQIQSEFLNSFECSDTSKQDGQLKFNQWMDEYNTYKEMQSEDVIASSYFTTQRNPQYRIEFINDNYYFMENWFKNIYKMNLRMMVLHDDLSEKFTSTFKNNYKKADFVKITDFKDYLPNDRRFLGYYDYILAHPEIRRMIFTDMRDVVIQNDPFEVMEVLGDYGYVGSDKPFKRTVSETDYSEVSFVFKRCYQDPLDYHNDMKLLGFLNAGTIGGSRHMMLTFLTRFFQYFQISSKNNCNMAIVEIIFHKCLFSQLYFGWPINAAFKSNKPNIPGLAVLHKWTLDSYN